MTEVGGLQPRKPNVPPLPPSGLAAPGRVIARTPTAAIKDAQASTLTALRESGLTLPITGHVEASTKTAKDGTITIVFNKGTTGLTPEQKTKIKALLEKYLNAENIKQDPSVGSKKIGAGINFSFEVDIQPAAPTPPAGPGVQA
jgi:hypothetical protein